MKRLIVCIVLLLFSVVFTSIAETTPANAEVIDSNYQRAKRIACGYLSVLIKKGLSSWIVLCVLRVKNWDCCKVDYVVTVSGVGFG